MTTDTRTTIKLEGAALERVKAFTKGDRELIEQLNALVDQMNALKKQRSENKEATWKDLEAILPRVAEGNWRLDVEHIGIDVAVVVPVADEEGMPAILKSLLAGVEK